MSIYKVEAVWKRAVKMPVNSNGILLRGTCNTIKYNRGFRL